MSGRAPALLVLLLAGASLALVRRRRRRRRLVSARWFIVTAPRFVASRSAVLARALATSRYVGCPSRRLGLPTRSVAVAPFPSRLPRRLRVFRRPAAFGFLRTTLVLFDTAQIATPASGYPSDSGQSTTVTRVERTALWQWSSKRKNCFRFGSAWCLKNSTAAESSHRRVTNVSSRSRRSSRNACSSALPTSERSASRRCFTKSTLASCVPSESFSALDAPPIAQTRSQRWQQATHASKCPSLCRSYS